MYLAPTDAQRFIQGYKLQMLVCAWTATDSRMIVRHTTSYLSLPLTDG